ncbi:MAG: hypothetical protein JNK48_14140 [Bryobacterales bacterium]|nr:hypothetical protein [Bryobacterales bacterium]
MLGIAASVLVAAEKPDFSGVWKIDVSATKTEPFPLPKTSTLTLTVVHRDPELSVSQRTDGGLPRDYQYKTNGEKTENLSPHDVKLQSEATWAGAELVIRTAMSAAAGAAKMEDRWTLSADGKTLTIVKTSPMLRGKSTYTYRRGR